MTASHVFGRHPALFSLMSARWMNTQRHVPGSINLPLSEIDTIETVIPDRSTPLFAYCLVGSRSRQAVSRMRSMGYSQAESIGGIRSYRGELTY